MKIAELKTFFLLPSILPQEGKEGGGEEKKKDEG